MSVRDIPKNAYLAAVDMLLNNIMPIEYQSVEWGIYAGKAPFQLLGTVLLADSAKRYCILALITHMFNLRRRQVSLNQIRTFYANDGEDVEPWVFELQQN